MTSQATYDIRRGNERGQTNLGWLHSKHSFSFGQYHDPSRMGFRTLRVLNDDIVEPGGGFGEHGHRDMEIISWVLDGALEHRDSTGTEGTIRPGDVQVMTAGRGIRHSEMNGSTTDQVHFLQIWIEPESRGLQPSYQQTTFGRDARLNRWQLVASPDGRDGSLRIHQDALLKIADLDAGQQLEVSLGETRYGYLHVAFGSVSVDDTTLHAGDAITLEGKADLTIGSLESSQLLFFDLA